MQSLLLRLRSKARGVAKVNQVERSNRLMYRFTDPILNDVEATADERNPAPPGMQKKPVNTGIDYLSTGKGFLPSKVSTTTWHGKFSISQRMKDPRWCHNHPPNVCQSSLDKHCCTWEEHHVVRVQLSRYSEKLRWQWNITSFNRSYIFKWQFFSIVMFVF